MSTHSAWNIKAFCAVAAMVAAALVFRAEAADAVRPQRIVSVNLCTDQLLVELAPRGHIAAVTNLASDPLSTPVPEKALGLAVTDGTAESVLAFDPDLVLVTPFTSPATVSLLRRLGRRVVAVPLAQDFAGIRVAIRATADAIGDAAAGEQLVMRFDVALRLAEKRVTAIGGNAPRAAVYQVNNYVAGTSGIVDEALRRAGFSNHAAGYGIGLGRQVSLEDIVTSPPDVLVLSSGPNDYATTVADNLRHPVLQRMAARMPSVIVPWSLWLCGTQHIVRAVEMLVDARMHTQRGRTP
jgi:iron complex transport system substrate-binding protein